MKYKTSEIAEYDGRERILTRQYNENNYMFYSLSQDRFRNNADEEIVGSYNGCGNGYVVVDKESDTVIRMSYSNDGKTIELEQNIEMVDLYEPILIWRNEKEECYFANFSCWQACLF